jgi:hypothetical protein
LHLRGASFHKRKVKNKMSQPPIDDFQNRIQHILNEKKVVRHEGRSEFKLTRSVYGGWDIIQANIPGWVFQKEE